MLRIEEICTNVDDDFRDHLLAMDDGRLNALLADSTALRHLLPLGVSYKEAVAAITAILEFRAQPPEEPEPEPARAKRAPRKKAPPVPRAGEEIVPPDPRVEAAAEPAPVAPVPAPPPIPVSSPCDDRLSLPPLKLRWRDRIILVLPVALAAAVLVSLMIKR